MVAERDQTVERCPDRGGDLLGELDPAASVPIDSLEVPHHQVDDVLVAGLLRGPAALRDGAARPAGLLGATPSLSR
jgi:hypothetical protein